MKYLKINITGKVYHTGYRYFIKEKASQLNITGCVFYCPDRSVEILATGRNNDLDEFVKQSRIGNHDSSVEEIRLSEIPSLAFDSFEVIDEETSIDTIVKEIHKFKNEAV
ncbi:MAG: acylphosphatase [Bacteroidetes bacterium]|nr:acylphosphatase [Bacteroidota bacterium]